MRPSKRFDVSNYRSTGFFLKGPLASLENPPYTSNKKASWYTLNGTQQPSSSMTFTRRCLSYLARKWSSLLGGACIVGFLAITMYGLSLADNYTCIEGTHTVREGDSAWSVASQRCSGDRQHAMHDILTINGGDPLYGVGQVLIIPSSGG